MACKYVKTVSVLVFLAFLISLPACKTPPPPEPPPEEIVEIEEKFEIAGTWFSGNHQARVVYQYRFDGTGCEITINQGSNFTLTYRPFNYQLTETNININFTDVMRPPSINFNYEKTTPTRIRKINYTPGFSPAFLKQEMTDLEGLWRRDSTDNIEYIFGARNFMLRLQNGVPAATGNFILSNNSLILNDLHRCTDYYMLRWVTSTSAHENYSYRLTNGHLSLNSSGREIILKRYSH